MRCKLKNHIAELRKNEGLTQQQLADAVAVTRQTIISLENGRYTASLPLAFKLSAFFCRPIEELFEMDDE